MQTVEQLVEAVGAERWREACAAAVKDSWRKDYGRGPGPWHESGHDMVPWDLEDLIWDQGTLIERFRFMQVVFRQMPTYAYLLQLTFHLDEFNKRERMELWQWAKDCLADRRSPLANPVGYWLWCDVFEAGAGPEDIERAREAFVELTRDTSQRQVLQSVLENSGPAPFDLKADLYSRLINDPEWHPWILESLLRSAGDVYGILDVVAARKHVSMLKVPGRAEELEKFAKALMNPVPKKFPSTLADAVRAEQGMQE